MNIINEADKIWKERQDINSKKTGYTSSAKRFAKKEHAEHLLQSVLSGSMGRVAQQLSDLNFEAGATVLDIGAGPGTLAVPLSKRGCIVTVVEPSDAMEECMEIYLSKEGVGKERVGKEGGGKEGGDDFITPIKRIPSIIEEIDVDSIGRFDYVISSFAMGVYELRETLLKMHALAKKEVHIFWFVSNPTWAVLDDEIRAIIRPTEKSARVYSDLIWRCLYEEGIHANVCVFENKDKNTYASVDEAVADRVESLSPVTPEQEKIIREFVSTRLIFEDGHYHYKDVGKYAHIWWDVRENKVNGDE